MKIYKVQSGILIAYNHQFYLLANQDWDQFINRDDLYEQIEASVGKYQLITEADAQTKLASELLPPIGSQEVWASGVTYMRSKVARQEESKEAGGGDFYDKVYNAPRPELFFKATPHRVVGSGQGVNIRKDSTWNVPEPELTLLVTSGGKIVGYTIGNDMSSRSIEGENPLYLPQAKTYDKSCGLGPCIFVSQKPIPRNSRIELLILRSEKAVFKGEITLESLKRKEEELVEYLCRESSFPAGCFLLTGTGIVPDHDFTLHSGDQIHISIDHIGKLINPVN